MPLSATKKRVKLPDNVNRDELIDELVDWLRNSDEVRQVVRHDADESVTIEAETTATLLTWGQEIQVTLEGEEAFIQVESPDQWIDWGKSEKTAREISELLNDDRSSSDRVPA